LLGGAPTDTTKENTFWRLPEGQIDTRICGCLTNALDEVEMENRMITVTEHAVEKIQDAVKDSGDNPTVRVYVAGFG